MSAKLRISSAQAIEGDLYEVMGEDGILVVYDTVVCAIVDGDIYHHKHVFYGHGKDPHGFEHADRNAKESAESLAGRVVDAGVIDTAHWDLVGNLSELEDPLERLEREWSDTSDHYC